MPKLVRQRATDLWGALPPQTRALLQHLAQTATGLGMRSALVGGTVRDLALGRSLDYDLDVVVQGDALALAQGLATAGGAVLAAHVAFGTATVELPWRTDGQRVSVDLVSARTESYARPTALPTIALANIEADLGRRDFSVNALALELADATQDDLRLIDPHGGIADLEAGVLRVLHNRSFIDDPTRMLRGLRLAARLGIDFEPHSARLLKEALAAELLEQTSPDRIRAELCLVLNEPRPDLVLQLGDSLGITPHIAAPLRWEPEVGSHMAAVLAHRGNLPPEATTSALALGLLTYRLTSSQREELIRRYRLPGNAARLLREVGAIQQLQPALAVHGLAASMLDRLLQPFAVVSLAIAGLWEPAPVATAIERYLQELRPTQPLLNGNDLLSLGVPPGPQLGALLAELRGALLDGAVTTREDGLGWVRGRLGR